MTKIIQITDTHIVSEGELVYGMVDTASALEATVATINRLLPQIGPVELAIVTGDLTENGTAAEYQHFSKIMSALDLPCHVLPGNHDRRAPMLEHFGSGTQPDRALAPSDAMVWSTDTDDFRIIGLDTLVEGKAHGALSDTSVAFLNEQLTASAGKPVLIGLHHPPFPVGILPMDIQNLRETDALSAALAGYPGELRIICGHLHRSIAGLFAGRLCQVCPGTSHAVTLDQRETASNSLTVEPGGFMLHEWRDGRFLSHLIPVGSYPGPYSFAGNN